METMTDTINTDELSSTVSSMIRGTDNNGNYLFESYSPKSPVTAQAGYRVATVLYKTNNKTGKIAGSNSCLIIPSLTDQVIKDNQDKLLAHVKHMLELEQNRMIKELHLKKVTFVEPALISFDAILASLETESVSGRINKDMIVAWFASYIQDSLILLFADKLGCEIERYQDVTSKLFLTVKVYSDMFGKLASNTTNYQPTEAKQLMQALTVCTTENVAALNDVITIKIKEKLDKMINPVNTMELLGF